MNNSLGCRIDTVNSELAQMNHRTTPQRGGRREIHTSRTNQDPNEQEESSRNADSNPRFDEIPQDNPEDELEPRVDPTKRATQNGRLTSSQIFWKQARMIAQHHEGRWTKIVSNWNPATSTKQKGHRKQGVTSNEKGGPLQHLLATGQNQQRRQRPHE